MQRFNAGFTAIAMLGVTPAVEDRPMATLWQITRGPRIGRAWPIIKQERKGKQNKHIGDFKIEEPGEAVANRRLPRKSVADTCRVKVGGS